MSAVSLSWRTITGSNNRQFLVKGAELSRALFGSHSRFAVYEVRTFDGVNHGREYVIRDAAAISDADVKDGKRPPIVGRTDSYDKLLEFVARQSDTLTPW